MDLSDYFELTKIKTEPVDEDYFALDSAIKAENDNYSVNSLPRNNESFDSVKVEDDYFLYKSDFLNKSEYCKNEDDANNNINLSTKPKTFESEHKINVEEQKVATNEIFQIYSGIGCDNECKVNHYFEKHTCTLCLMKFKEPLALDTHILAKHRSDSSALKLITRKIFECLLCSYKSLKKANFKRHLGVHEGIAVKKAPNLKIYNCFHCSYSTKDKGSIIKHLRLHRDNSKLPFSCKGCQKKFNEKNSLDSHIVKNHLYDIELMKTITNKVYECDFCEYIDVNKFKVMRHTAAKHVKKERKKYNRKKEKSGCE